MVSVNKGNTPTDFDAVVVGAGFSGLYMLHRLREAGFSTRVFEAVDGVGGVWYWNRYPGARCDTESIYYNYTFSEELYKEWNWSHRFADQEEILRYLNYAADKFNLRKDIQFNTRVNSAYYDEVNNHWKITLNDGSIVTAKFFISGVGGLSTPYVPNIKGLDSFKGEWYHTGRWPRDKKVDFKGKKVAVIGTGSSGVQSIPIIAEDAEQLTVFQRSPQYVCPARNHPHDPENLNELKKNYKQIKEEMRTSFFGQLAIKATKSTFEDSPDERQKTYEKAWQRGGHLLGVYNDLLFNKEANELVSEFIRSKISEKVNDPKIVEKLMPDYYYGTKRPILDTNYFETYNRENVTLVDVKESPIQEITPNGIRTKDAEYELDMIVFATGFDAMTGTLFQMDIRGRDGISLKEKWTEGAETRTYLGLTTAGFPNMFMITGPQSPSVISTVTVSIEQHVEWVSDCIKYMHEHGIHKIEATIEAEEEWSKHVDEVADATLYKYTDSWYTGANIEGKPRKFSIYIGGVGEYKKICDEVAQNEYKGFSFLT